MRHMLELGRVDQEEEDQVAGGAQFMSQVIVHTIPAICLALGLPSKKSLSFRVSVAHFSATPCTNLCKVQTSGGASGIEGCSEGCVCERVFEKGGICAIRLTSRPTTTYLGSNQGQYNQCFNSRFYQTLKYTLHSLNCLI